MPFLYGFAIAIFIVNIVIAISTANTFAAIAWVCAALWALVALLERTIK